MKHLSTVTEAPRAPSEAPCEELMPASVEELQQIERVVALTARQPGWTHLDIARLMAHEAAIGERMVRLLVELATPCPVVVETFAASETGSWEPLDRLAHAAGMERRWSAEAFTDGPGPKPGGVYHLLTFSAATCPAELVGAYGFPLLERFYYRPANLREALCLLRQHHGILRGQGLVICGATSKNDPSYFPLVSPSGSRPTFRSCRDEFCLSPSRHFVLAAPSPTT